MEHRSRSKRLDGLKWTDDAPCTQLFLDGEGLSYTVDETPEQIYDLIAKATDIV